MGKNHFEGSLYDCLVLFSNYKKKTNVETPTIKNVKKTFIRFTILLSRFI